MERVGTLFFGSGTFALPALQRLAEGNSPGAERIQLRAVVTAPPRPAGRRGDLQATPVASAAAILGLPVLTPGTLRADEVVEQLRSLRADLIVLADYGRIIPAALLDLPRHGALNLHPSLLPRHRGAAPVPAAILAGDAVTGISLMRMDEGMDTGPLIAQRELALEGTEVTPGLEAHLAEMGAALLVEQLPAWLDGTITARPQPSEGATVTRPLRRSDGRLDPARPALELGRQVRAYQPWPGSFLEWAGERLIVWRASVVADMAGQQVVGAAPPGAAAPGFDAGTAGADAGAASDAAAATHSAGAATQSAGPPVPDARAATPSAGPPVPDAGAATQSAGPPVPDARAPVAIVPIGDGLALRTSRGLLRLDEVQPAGGRRMSGAQYRRGRHL